MSLIFQNMLERAAAVRDAFTPAENTAARVGKLFVDIVEQLVKSKVRIDSLQNNWDNLQLPEIDLSSYITKKDAAATYATITALDLKLDKSDFDELFEKVNINGSDFIKAKIGRAHV